MSLIFRKKNSRPRSPGGITLIEVVIGLALLATLLVTALAAGSAHMRQAKTAESKIAAIRLLDRFLTQWAAEGYRQLPEAQQWQRTDIEEVRIAIDDLGLAGLPQADLRRISVSIVEKNSGRALTFAEIVLPDGVANSALSESR